MSAVTAQFLSSANSANLGDISIPHNLQDTSRFARLVGENENIICYAEILIIGFLISFWPNGYSIVSQAHKHHLETKERTDLTFDIDDPFF